MKYICNQCANVFEENDIIIHYKTGEKGLEIVSICQCCLDQYMKKLELNSNKKIENDFRNKIKRKW